MRTSNLSPVRVNIEPYRCLDHLCIIVVEFLATDPEAVLISHQKSKLKYEILELM
jgi:hypothetical protein